MSSREEQKFRYKWESVMRRLALPSPTKLVAAYCAQYGDLDGNEIRPGEKRLALETCLGERTVREAFATLREIGLLVRVRSGSKMGRRRLADEYKLAIPENVADKVSEWNVRANRGRLGLVDDGTGDDLTRGARSPRRRPAPPAGDEPEENRTNQPTAREEQRQEMPVIAENTGSTLQEPPAGAAAHHNSDHTSMTPTPETVLLSQQPLTSREDEAEEDPISPPADLASRRRCPHGRSSRRNDRGQPRCEDCRAAEVQAVAVEQIEQAATTVRVGPSRCEEHKLPAHLCTFCRRGLRGG